jgi:hypothetical protein
MRNVSDKFVEKIKTHILCSITFFPKISLFVGRIWYSQTGCNDNITRHGKLAICMPEIKEKYIHALIFNTYCISTAKMVTRTHLSIKVHIHCMSYVYYCVYYYST